MSSSQAVIPQAANPELDANSEATKPESEAKPEASKSQRELYTKKPKQARVFERHFRGESDRKIAREVGLDPGTVRRILSQEQVVSLQAELESRALRMGPQCLDVYQEVLDSEYLAMAFAAATKTLEGIGVFNKRGMMRTIDDAKARHLRSEEEDVKCALGPGQFQWPVKLVPKPNAKKGPARKPPKPETSDKPLND